MEEIKEILETYKLVITNFDLQGFSHSTIEKIDRIEWDLDEGTIIALQGVINDITDSLSSMQSGSFYSTLGNTKDAAEKISILLVELKRLMPIVEARVFGNLTGTPKEYYKLGYVRSFVETIDNDTDPNLLQQMAEKIMDSETHPTKLVEGINLGCFNFSISGPPSDIDPKKIADKKKTNCYVHSFNGLSQVIYELPKEVPTFKEGISQKHTRQSITMVEGGKSTTQLSWTKKKYGIKRDEGGEHYLMVGKSYIPITEVPKRSGNFLDKYYGFVGKIPLFKPLINQDPYDRELVIRKNNLWRNTNKKIADVASKSPKKYIEAITESYRNLFEKEIIPTFIDVPSHVDTELLSKECTLTFFRELRSVMRKIEKALSSLEGSLSSTNIEDVLNKFVKTDSGMFYSTVIKVNIILAKKELL